MPYVAYNYNVPEKPGYYIKAKEAPAFKLKPECTRFVYKGLKKIYRQVKSLGRNPWEIIR
jgi:hypothetical protein